VLLAVAGAALASAAVAALPGAALAHGLVGRQDLPVPRWLFAWAAAVVLVISFVALAVLWPTARLQASTERRVLTVPAALDVLCGAVGVAVFAVVVYAGFAGVQTTPTANLAPTAIYVVFWVGLPFLTVLFGDVFRALNPWLALARAATWAGRRFGFVLPAARPYPTWLGRWPAAAGILAFAWLELVYHGRDDPSLLTTLAVAYATVQLLGMARFGIEPWSRNADAFGVYFGLFSTLAPLHWHDRALFLRPALSGATRVGVRAVPGTVALLCTMIGTTSFDGFSQGDL